MHILVSNDDGYTAEGISALAREMRRFGKVTIVAPEHNHSGSSNSLTLNRPLTVTKTADDVFVVSGTPSDCVHMALTGLLGERPDLVVSGINCGANMGDDTMYSGTVAAAIEGYIFGINSIAFSQTDRGWGELESAARVAGIVAGFEIEGVNQFQCFGVAPGAEVVAEGGEKFRNGLSVFRGVAEAHAIKNVVHRRRISFPQDFFLLLYFLFRFFQEKRFVRTEGNPAEMRSL